MIEHFVRLLPPSVMSLIDVARSLVVVCMWRGMVDHCGLSLVFPYGNDGQGTTHLLQNCCVFCLHLSFSTGGFSTSV
jgi:hypothetical protein